MSDLQLTIAAATVEVGLAVLVVLAVFIVKPARRRTVVVLGALTLPSAVMALLAYAQFIDPTPGSMAGAGWVMGFAAYAFIFVGGVFISFSPLPMNLYGRYLLGLVSAPVSVGLLLLLPRVIT
jgi:hypothetical protein